VNKFTARLPVINRKILDNHSPERGEDVMVFRYPPKPSLTTSSAWLVFPTRWPAS
jgi:signal peptidase I